MAKGLWFMTQNTYEILIGLPQQGRQMQVG